MAGCAGLSLLFAVVPGAALAAPPDNDDIAGRENITGDTTFTGTTVDATRETNEPYNAGGDGGSV